MKAGYLIHRLIRYKLFHVLYWGWSFVKLYHEKLNFIGKDSLLIPNVINDIFFQMAGVYLVLYYVRPKFFHPHKYGRFIIVSIIAISLTSILHLLGGMLLVFLYSGALYNGILIVFLTNFVDTFIKAAIFLTAVSLFGWFQLEQKNKRLEREKLEYELAFLNTQVNPHFLFNTLNTLANLIDENPSAAITYTERLSGLYKNMLSFRNKTLITLKEEWEILSDYLFIQKGRFGTALHVQAAIPEKLMNDKRIIPMALQMLVENAIKHNVVSLVQPLIIRIEANQEEIFVRNNLNPKLSKEKGEGLTLYNIRKRYNLLIQRPVSFGIRDKDYIVNLPLF